MNRRSFLSSSLALGATALPNDGRSQQPSNSQANDIFAEILQLPNYCSHEHWGSIFSMGTQEGGFRADFQAGVLPTRQTTLADLIIDPYMGGHLQATGISPWDLSDGEQKTDIYSLFTRTPKRGMKALTKLTHSQRLTGTWLCCRHGIQAVYDFDIEQYEPDQLIEVNQKIDQNYKNLYQWYNELSRDYFTNVIRPVHPEYYASMDTPAAVPENKLIRTVLRIDPFMDLWKDKIRRKKLAAISGIEPMDALTWRQFLQRIFSLAKDHNAFGIKQLQAYSRDLDFIVRDDSSIKFTGDLTDHEERALKDWIMHECCKLADDLSWPHQIHVGTHNLPQSNPLPLQRLVQRYAHQSLVLLHCWPFIDESGYLAKQHATIYIDTCWQPVLNPEFLRRSLQMWLNYVPTTKIMMGNDATSIEMALGSSILAKQVLAETLGESADRLHFDANHLLEVARGFLHDNAASLYGHSS